ncbi:MAG: 3-isopropylmalate dehydrogenase [Acidobacteriota bacterium]
MRTYRIALLPGDGIGPEVVEGARRVLEAVADRADLDFRFEVAAVGGAAIDAYGSPLPAPTLDLCRSCDAVLLGAVGGPQWSDPSASVRPEQGLLSLRRELGLFANLRPIPVFPELQGLTPLRPEVLAGVDLLVVRELTGGLYFGPRKEQGADSDAWDTLLYSEAEVERVARVAFTAARGRRRRVISVDKANVLASMRLWRRVVERVASEFPDVELEHRLVDSCAMDLVRQPAGIDVLLAGNLFGDILSDLAAVLAGSLGLLPSASLGEGSLGLYEPVHGSAPDLAGLGVANPVAAVLSSAMLLRHSLDLDDEARDVEIAVSAALATHRTADVAAAGETAIGTSEMIDAILHQLDHPAPIPSQAGQGR